MSTAFGIVTTEEAERRWPRSWAKVRAAEDFVEGKQQHFACRHVIDGAEAFICTDHLGAGLLCGRCMEKHHIPRHSLAEEALCDECGDLFERLHPLVCTSNLGRLRIREPRGRSAVLARPVTFLAVGCCGGCWAPT